MICMIIKNRWNCKRFFINSCLQQYLLFKIPHKIRKILIIELFKKN